MRRKPQYLTACYAKHFTIFQINFKISRLSKKSRLAGQKPVGHDFTYLTAFSEGGAPPASPPFRVCHIKNSLSFMISYCFFAVNKHSLKMKNSTIKRIIWPFRAIHRKNCQWRSRFLGAILSSQIPKGDWLPCAV